MKKILFVIGILAGVSASSQTIIDSTFEF